MRKKSSYDQSTRIFDAVLSTAPLISYLRFGVYRVDECAAVAVPGPDFPVLGSSSAGKHRGLPGTPRKGFHSGVMVTAKGNFDVQI